MSRRVRRLAVPWLITFIVCFVTLTGSFAARSVVLAQPEPPPGPLDPQPLPGDCSAGPGYSPAPDSSGARWIHPGPGFWMYHRARAESPPFYVRAHYHIDGLAGWVFAAKYVWEPYLRNIVSTFAGYAGEPNEYIPDPPTPIDPQKFQELISRIVASRGGIDPLEPTQAQVRMVIDLTNTSRRMLDKAIASGVDPMAASVACIQGVNTSSGSASTAYVYVNTTIRDGWLLTEAKAYTPDSDWWNTAETHYDVYHDGRRARADRERVGAPSPNPTTDHWYKTYQCSDCKCYGTTSAKAVYATGYDWEQEYDVDYAEDTNCGR